MCLYIHIHMCIRQVPKYCGHVKQNIDVTHNDITYIYIYMYYVYIYTH